MADVNVAEEAPVPGADTTELEKLNSYTDEGTGEQATQPSAQPAATTEEPPASQTTGKGASKKRAPRKKSSAAAAAGEKRERVEGEEPAAGEEIVGKEKKPKRTRTTKAAKAEAKATEGEAEAAEAETAGAMKKKGPGRPRKSSKKEREDAAGVAEGETTAMEVDVGGAPVPEAENVPAAEGEVTAPETVTEPEPSKKKRGPGRPKKSEPGGNATAEHEEGTKEDVPAARTRAKEGSEIVQQQPAVAAA